MRFEWDEDKAKLNERNHSVSFDEARTVFGDAFAIHGADRDDVPTDQCGVRRSAREMTMKKKNAAESDAPLDREFDFRKGRPNPHFVAYHGGKVIRVLDADLAEQFPDNKSVNDALRSIAAAPKKKISARRLTAKRERR